LPTILYSPQIRKLSKCLKFAELWYFILFWKEFLGICFDKERNKMAEKKNNKTKHSNYFYEFLFFNSSHIIKK
jgi:hypothetical protein